MKRIISLLLALTVLVGTMSMAVFAGVIQPRAALCSDCGIGTMPLTDTIESVTPTGATRQCTHFPPSFMYFDEQKEYTITRVYTCTYCHLEERNVTHKTVWECPHL